MLQTNDLGHPLRVIVYDFGLDVNGYAKCVRNPPVYIPAQCPYCVEVGTLIGHGVRKRSVWLTKSIHVIFIYVRRLKCSRHKGGEKRGCGQSFTILPNFLHPLRRYALREIQPVLQSRFVEKHSYGTMERTAPSPSASTQREWVRSFTLSACLWLRILVAKFAELNPGMVLPRFIEQGTQAGLLAFAIVCADWLRMQQARPPAGEMEVIETLWLWGSLAVKTLLLPPTRCRAGPQRRRC